MDTASGKKWHTLSIIFTMFQRDFSRALPLTRLDEFLIKEEEEVLTNLRLTMSASLAEVRISTCQFLTTALILTNGWVIAWLATRSETSFSYPSSSQVTTFLTFPPGLAIPWLATHLISSKLLSALKFSSRTRRLSLRSKWKMVSSSRYLEYSWRDDGSRYLDGKFYILLTCSTRSNFEV